MNRTANSLNVLSTGILLVCTSIVSCTNAQHKTLGPIENNHLIDSLIVVKKVNEKTVLILFGSDAIAAIKTPDGIVVIDAGISNGLTSKYREIIAKEFQGDDFEYVINTHCHPDHYGGNSVFYEANIIGQENGLQEISEQWANPEKTKRSIANIVEGYELKLKEYKIYTEEWYYVFTQKTRYYNALIDAEMQIPIKYPDVTFSDSQQIDLGDMKFEMIYFGNCHSKSDILIYVPALRILFTGDLFFKYGRPSINETLMKDKAKWGNAIVWIENRIKNIDTIISGHGEFLSIDDLESFNRNIKEKCLN